MSAQTATQVARVLIADDQTLFRSGLAGLLNEDKRGGPVPLLRAGGDPRPPRRQPAR